ncbi:hypothetical protein SAMN04487975_12411 [Planococcus glaciei]|uniref:hypothetical protein n=1 Tax=Planococcus glaciei TaxID=459472 RepID=UPI00088A6E6D|nr:hypothetical protein [Planococcus glaciei]SDI64501.1 hypothetical protein SAMN04487975_12411 [Planococcus glaciei]
MRTALMGLLVAGLLLSGCSKTAESETLKEPSETNNQERGNLLEGNKDVSKSILRGSAKVIKEDYSLEDLREILGSPENKESEIWLYQNESGDYKFEEKNGTIQSIQVELSQKESLHYTEAFDYLGLDIELGTEIDSGGYEAEGFSEYDVVGEDAETVLIERFSGTGGSSVSVSVRGAFGEEDGSIWLDCDGDGNMIYIEMNRNDPYEEYSSDSVEEEITDDLTDEITVYSLIQNDVRIGDFAEELSKVDPTQYNEEYDVYSFSLSNSLYGHISTNLIHTLTVRFDGNMIPLDEAKEIIPSILPEDARLVESHSESPYIFYNYTSDSLPSPSTIEVQVGAFGDAVQVIGFTADIGTTAYYNN